MGTAQASPIENFVVAQDGSGGTLESFVEAQTQDKLLSAISMIQITGGTVTTFSDTEIDASLNAYHDVGSVSTLFQDGNRISSVATPASYQDAAIGVITAAVAGRVMIFRPTTT